MARITAKANASDGTEFDVSLGGKTVTLNVAGNLASGSANGITGQALFGALADLWKSGSTHNRYQFPFAMVDGPIATMIELREGWEFANAASIALVRSCGIAYKNTSGTVTAEWACFEQLGTLADNAHQPYHVIGSATTPTDFGVADEFNEPIQIYGDGTHGSVDERSATSAGFYVREAGFSYGYYGLSSAQSLTTLEPRNYQIPMSTATDAQIVTSGPSGSPYSGMTLTLGATTNTINGVSYDFAEGVIAANSGTVQQVYDWFQNLLLSTGDIDSGAGTQRGDIYTDGSLTLAAGILTTSQGLTITGIASADASNIVHVDDTGTARQEAVSATGEVSDMPTAGDAIRLQVVNLTGKTASAWQAATAYSVGDKVLRTTGTGSESVEGLFFQCTTAGTSGGSEPTWDTTPTNTTADNTATWTTRAIAAYSGDPAGATYSVSYTDGEDYSAGDSLRIRFSEHTDSTSFKTFAQNVTVSASGWAVTCEEESDPVYSTNAVDGSSVTKFSADTGASEINLVVASNFSAAEAYAFFCYQLTTAAGISAFWGGVVAADVGNYKIVTATLALKFDNETTATQRQTDTARIYRDDDAYPVKDPTTSGYGIDINWKNVVYVVSTGGSALTAPEKIELTAAVTQATTAASQATIARKALINRQHTDDETGTMYVYDDADTAVEYEAPLWDDDEGTTRWDGTNAIKRRDQLVAP